MRARVIGTGLWTPGYPSSQAWLAGAEDRSATAPAASIADSRVKRGTSLLTRMQLTVVEEAGREAGMDLSTVSTVFGSAGGEIGTALLQLDMMQTGDGIVSPTRFKNSVHNTGSGVFAIAAKNRSFTTAIAAGTHTLAAVLLESCALLEDGHDAVIAVVADEPLPEPLDRFLDYAPLALAFALCPYAEGDEALAVLGPIQPRATATDGDVPERFRQNPIAPALRLFEAVRGGAPCRVSLSAVDGLGPAVEVAS